MVFSKGWSALMRRNLIYRRRNWMATIAELALPILFCSLLVALKKAAEKSDHFKPRQIEATFPSDLQAIQIFSFTDYVTALQAKRICVSKSNNTHAKKDLQFHTLNHTFVITGMPQHGRNWQVPLIRCDSTMCKEEGEEAYQYCHYPKLGLAASDVDDEGGFQRAKDFQKYIYKRYPQLTNASLPAVKDGALVRLFQSNNELEDYIQHPGYGAESERPKLAMAIVFKGNNTKDYDYTIRVNSTNTNAPEWTNNRAMARTTPDTNRLFASFAKREIEACGVAVSGPPQGPLQYTCTGQYIVNGLLTMQRFLHDWIMVDTGAFDAGLYVAEHGVKFVSFPTKAYEEDGFYTVLKDFMALILTLGFLYPCASMISYLASEREVGQSEFLVMMGATKWEIESSWFCTFFMLHFVTAALLTRASLPLFARSHSGLLWLFWQSSCLAFIVFSSWVPSLVSNQAKTASRTVLIGLLVFLAGYFLSQAVDFEEGDPLWLRVLCLHPVSAFGYGIQEIGRLEDASVGATWHSWRTTDSPSGFTVFTALQFLWLDCLLGSLVSWYFNRVIPGSEGGYTLPYAFPFRSSFWFPSNERNEALDEEFPLKYAAARIEDDIPVESVSDSLQSQAQSGKSIEIHNLRKVFSTKMGSSVTAVDGLNLSLHMGQVTALLGHNGSGKSTTINMLTGSTRPTDGFHVVTGKDSGTQMSEIRKSLGICLQHNDGLFPKLTVKETVRLFSHLKGKTSSEDAIDEALREVALYDKGQSLVMNLSGGQKRKLSVAIAFIGDSKVVILDEPTSGMDPFSRRFIWNVIKQKRQGRIVLLTTHFLDEADILADKIAILANGRLQCVGSSLFLKKAAGVGYKLTIEKNNILSQSVEVLEGGNLLDNQIKDVVTREVAEAKFLSVSGNELSFHLPLESTSKFSALLKGLEKEVEQRSISSFGVGMTTLEEVFQKSIGPQHLNKQLPSTTQTATDKADTLESEQCNWEQQNSKNLALKQMGALLRKRKINFKRDKKAWLCTTLIPSLFVFVGFLSLKYAYPDRDLVPLALDLKALSNANSDVETTKDRFPIPFNTPGSRFRCQPGWCSYQMPLIEEKATNELYFYCGAQSYLLSLPNCSQDYSSEIMSRLSPDGITPTSDIVHNIDESSRSILKSADNFAAPQYGAIYFTHGANSTVAPETLYNDKVLHQCHKRKNKYTLDNECDLYSGLGYVVGYNFTALHAAPLFHRLADQAIIREAIDDDKFRISTTIHPLPRTQTESQFTKEDDVFNLWFMLVFSLPFIAGHVASFLVEERQSKAKHLQTIAGVKPITYFSSNLIWDTVNYQIPFCLIVMLMYLFNVDVFTTTKHDTLKGVLLLLFLFGPAAASFAYCASFLFSSASLCNIFIIMFGFLTGMAGPITSFTLRLIASDPQNPWETLLHVARAVERAGLCFPSSCMGKGLFYTMNIGTLEMRAARELSVFDPLVMKNELIALAIQTVAYLLLAVCIDYLQANPDIGAFCSYFKSFLACNFRPKYQECSTEDKEEDSDVIAEEERVESEDTSDDVIVLRQVSKVYGTEKVAVDNLSLGISEGECFGLLGVNGSGKTTTMSILTSEFPPTHGEVTIGTTDSSSGSQKIGFCPQFDAIFENLTGQEHVEFYASIKGMSSKGAKTAAEKLLSHVGISERDKDRLSSHYSGGTKRKLSMACALVGDPSVVLFDEVTTGIDPVSRREIWDTISALTVRTNPKTNQKTCAILTTHSMEECEALCSRIGIMSKGRLLCLGSAQRLKSKFGQGYQLEVRVRTVHENDTDFAAICEKLSFYHGSRSDIEATPKEEILFDVQKAHSSLSSLTGDHSLSHLLVRDNNSNEASSTEDFISLAVLASLATLELRMQSLDQFVYSAYRGALKREQQDTKARYEISSSTTSLADIFSSLESNRERLWLSEYGVNQTSLEQVFNMLAAEDSEHLKSKPNHTIV